MTLQELLTRLQERIALCVQLRIELHERVEKLKYQKARLREQFR